MKRLGALAFLLTLLAAGEAAAWCRSRTEAPTDPFGCATEGLPLRWQSVCLGFSLNVQGSPELDWDTFAREASVAAARWHQTPCDGSSDLLPYLQVLRLADTTQRTGYNPRGPNSNSVWFNGVWTLDRLHRPMAIAITVVTFDRDTGQLLDADMELNQRSDANPSGFTFTVDTPSPDSADLPTILTHEFGHFQGLAHTPDMTAVMFATAGLGEQRRMLQQDDTTAICTVYPSANVPDQSCNPVPFGGLAITAEGARVRGNCGARPTGKHGGAGAACVLGLLLGLRSRRREPR